MAISQYLRTGTPKFYIDAVLLARQLGEIKEESLHGGEPDGKFYLNPSNVTTLNFDSDDSDYFTLTFKNRVWANALEYFAILGHNFYSSNTRYIYKLQNSEGGSPAYPFGDFINTLGYNGWILRRHDPQTTSDVDRIHIRCQNYDPTDENNPIAKVGDFSLGWTYTMQHSPDLELTQNFSNESIKTQTTLGGHTLTNAGYNHPPAWIRQAWTTGTLNLEAKDRVTFPAGRRSWSLKFSYLTDDDSSNPLFPKNYNTSVGIFEWLGGDDPNTTEVEPSEYNIKEDFLSRVWFGTNCGQLPFLFTPDHNTTNPEYAICRITNTPSFTQVANNVYDVSLDIVEVW